MFKAKKLNQLSHLVDNGKIVTLNLKLADYIEKNFEKLFTNY